MLLIYNDNTNPYFNLAMEEYLLKNTNEDLFILWRNKPSIIVGKNQNTLSEINIDYVKDNSIPVVRRLSGGGAVFHDLGNINFTFISCNKNSFSDFKKFTQPIIDLLKTLGLNAEFSGRNDLLIDGKKFSGNAQYNYKNKVMHHGTLLFSSQISDLSDALKVKSIKFEGKGIKSVKSRVTNISSHLNEDIDILEFKNLLMNYIYSISSNNTFYNLTKDDIEKIENLVEEKYSTWEWNFGNSPKYSLLNELKYPGGNIEFNLEVEKGFITRIKFFGDFFGKDDISTLEVLLCGVRHEEQSLRDIFSHINIDNYFLGADSDILIAGILGAKQEVKAY
ncbi:MULTISPECIES: lipoate--protein ligase [unclassified Romboutsia]|uniref:lipoate--protein ligase n=1 Tax=unclassified Romboutsia TaxID=2626894 RepID=UPI0008234C2D|nr:MULTISPECIES: lipoate--protein ligase [unclassified Romboutsia]SCI24926.1 Lipoate-protein ligase LplJ [uncultured Clostridium sp.]